MSFEELINKLNNSQELPISEKINIFADGLEELSHDERMGNLEDIWITAIDLGLTNKFFYAEFNYDPVFAEQMVKYITYDVQTDLLGFRNKEEAERYIDAHFVYPESAKKELNFLITKHSE